MGKRIKKLPKVGAVTYPDYTATRGAVAGEVDVLRNKINELVEAVNSFKLWGEDKDKCGYREARKPLVGKVWSKRLKGEIGGEED